MPTSRKKRLKVLVSAYACEPDKGSEPEVGWRWVQQIARFHETWVLTRTNNRPAIENSQFTASATHVHFVYLDLPKWARFWKRGGRGVHLYYEIWQIMAALKGRSLQKDIPFDLVHHVTFVNDWVGPGVCAVKGRYIWGPIGSHPFVPIRYKSFIGTREYLRGILRLLLRYSARYRDPLFRISLRKARWILVANRECKGRLPESVQDRTLVFAQNGMEERDLDRRFRQHCGPLKIVSVGRLIGFKGFMLALQGFAGHVQNYPSSTLTIVGDGEQREQLQELSRELQIGQAVIFRGQLSRNAVLETMGNSDVFLFPSFEGAGMVVIEAMAKGLPVVCLDFGGPGEYVTEKCGVRVPLAEPSETVHGLARALDRLASDSALYESLSAGAIERVREQYLWDSVGDRLNNLYEKAVSRE